MKLQQGRCNWVAVFIPYQGAFVSHGPRSMPGSSDSSHGLRLPLGNWVDVCRQVSKWMPGLWWCLMEIDWAELDRDHFCPFPRKDVWQEPSCLAIWSCGRIPPEMKDTGVTSNLFLTSFYLAVWPFSFLLHQPQQIHLHTVYKYRTTRTSSWNVLGI